MGILIANFRDLGGLTGYNNQIIKTGKIFRSSQLSGLSKEEMDDLIQLDIKTIVDFRNKSEREQNPDDPIPNATYVSIDVLDNSNDLSPDITTIMNNANQINKLMDTIYASFVTSETANKGYSKFLELILSDEGTPLVFHCTFGKDRTGYGAALILKILGVSEKDILSNYIDSNQELKQFNQGLLDQLKKAYGFSDENIQEITPLLQVNSSYLEHTFLIIKNEYQDFDSYLEKALDFDQSKLTLFRKKFLVDE